MSQPMSSPMTAMADYCVVEGCRSREYPLHYVYYQNRFLRLCTNCVIKVNPGNFCSHCLSPLYDSPRVPIVHCSQCRMVTHLNCLQNPNFASQFLCPSCRSSNSSRFRWFSHRSGTLINDFALRGLHLGASLVHEMNKKAVSTIKEEVEEKFTAMVDSELKAKMLDEACNKGAKQKNESNAVVNASSKMAANTDKCVREFDKRSSYHEMNVGGSVNNLVSQPSQISAVIELSQAKQGLVGSKANALNLACNNKKVAQIVGLVGPEANALNQACNNGKIAENGCKVNHLLPQKKQGLMSHGLTQPKCQNFKREIVKCKKARTSVLTRSVIISGPSSANLIPKPSAVCMHN